MMARDENLQAMERFTDEFWNQKKLDAADALFAPNSTMTPNAPGAPGGPEGMRQVAQSMFAAFPDYHVEIDKIVANDDKVAIRSIHTGTHQGEFMGTPASGKQATWTGMTAVRFENGKVVEMFWEADLLGLMQQIGPS
jgi:steroid delta-isomerase-like uncharacterized protein